MELFTSALFLLCICVFCYYHFIVKRQGLPPGPTPIPFIGNVHQVNLRAVHKTLTEWGKQYGGLYTVWLGERPEVVICDFPTMKEYMMGKTRDAFTGRPQHLALQHFNGGKHGIFLVEGDIWREQRRFSLHVLRDFGVGRNIMEVKIRIQVQELIHHLHDLTTNNNNNINNNGIITNTDIMDCNNIKNNMSTLDITSPIQLCVANVLGSILFGHNYGRGDERFEEIMNMLEEETQLFLRPDVILLQALPWLRHVPLFGHFGFDRVTELFERFFTFMKKEIAEHKESLQPEIEAEDFITAYLLELRRREKTGEPMGYFSEHQLAKLLGDLLVAGMETTVSTLKYGILYVLHYPDVQKKIHEELDLFHEKYKMIPGTAMADRQFLPYTAAFVNETQRLANVLPLNFPHALIKDVQVKGYKLKAGTMVFPQISSVMLDPEVFPDPERFEPARFLEADGKTLRKVEELVPFSVGKRNCAGESLARMELFLTFTALFWNFTFSSSEDNPPPDVEGIVGMVVQPQPYLVSLQRRKKSEINGNLHFQ